MLPGNLRLRLIGALLCVAACAFGALAARAQDRPALADSAQGAAAARADVEKFAARVDAQLAARGADRGSWGLLVADADTGAVLYEKNADHYFSPASNAKLFTTALALATVGPAYRFRTTIETHAALSPGGRLAGDLILVGRGDPNLSNRIFPYDKDVEREGPPEKVLSDLADQVVARGVREISGDIVADDSYLSYERFPEGWAVDDIMWSSGAPVSAIVVNDNTFTLTLRPGAREGDPVSFLAEPRAGYYTIENAIITGARGSAEKLRVSREPGSLIIHLSGSIPAGADARTLTIAVEEPAEYAAALLKQLLEERGVKIFGVARAVHAEPPPETLPERDMAEPRPTPGTQAAADAPPALVPAPAANAVPAAPAATVLAEHISLPLSEDVRLVNKISENLHAELLLRVAARESAGAVSIEDALAFAESWRDAAGLPPDGALLTDGSGLSRIDLVTPHAVVALLEYAAKQSWGDVFRASLPVAGEDGTLADRMKATAAAGRIAAKTGTLEHVNSLSGYAVSVGGAHLVFSFLSDDHAMRAHDAEEVLGAIAVAMVEEIQPSRTSTPAAMPAATPGAAQSAPPNPRKDNRR